MTHSYRRRQLVFVFVLLLALAIPISQTDVGQPTKDVHRQASSVQIARQQLEQLEIKGRAPKTGYSRDQFGGDWQTTGGCDTRNRILLRDLKNPQVNSDCEVLSGILQDPYTGKTINFQRGSGTSAAVQIDHIVAVSDAWQKGAQQLNYVQREAFYNDPLNLLAVDGLANERKSDGDAATWLPPNKSFRCQYVSRQIAVKAKYHLWVTEGEKQVIASILARCQ